VKILHSIDQDTKCEILVHALVGVSTPQTLKIIGYIKKQKIIVLVDSGSTHNFIDKILAKHLNCFVYLVENFQVLVANGGSIDCGGKCHNIKLSMGDYNLSSPMYAIPIGGVDVVLGIQWLRTLGTISTNYNDLFMRFKVEGIEYELNGLKSPPSQMINSHRMENILKKGCSGVIARLYSMEVKQENENIPLELKFEKMVQDMLDAGII
jgi:hypothetical protein